MSDTILIWGAGAIGGTIGAYLARAGEDVLFVDNAADHVAAMPTDLVDPTGAGDAYAAGFLAGYTAGLGRAKAVIIQCEQGADQGAEVGGIVAVPGYVLVFGGEDAIVVGNGEAGLVFPFAARVIV